MYTEQLNITAPNTLSNPIFLMIKYKADSTKTSLVFILLIIIVSAQTQSLSCHEACQRAVWRVGQTRADSGARERAMEMCEQSPPLLHCMKELTGSTVHTDTSKCKNLSHLPRSLLY